MLEPKLVINALEEKINDFLQYNIDFAKEKDFIEQSYEKFCSQSYEDMILKIEGIANPGAIPSEEFKKYPSFIVPFNNEFKNHEQARQWAKKNILNKVTVSVDGSQILPAKFFSVPVAVIQTGWFISYHNTEGKYIKDIDFEVLSPKEILSGKVKGKLFSETIVNIKRFQKEVDKIIELIIELKDLKPLIFFDGSFVLSFVDTMEDKELQGKYRDIIVKLLQTSQETQVPVIAYIDTTASRDISTLLTKFDSQENKETNFSDVNLLSSKMKWGDRSIFFTCARKGILEEYGDYKRGIGFCFFKSNNSNPARIDIPKWIFDKGCIENIIDIIRAEVIIGTGYPYTIETADVTAVIRGEDRERFYKIFQEFIEKHNLDLKISKKAVSKIRRR